MANTFSIEENACESKRLYALLDGGIRQRLMKYPGVRHVSVGLKITGDEMLWERCFHVYVDKKIDRSELRSKQLIPEDIDGIRTDVHEIGEASAASPFARSGNSISNSLEFGTAGRETILRGTIGAIGTDKSRSCNVVALTNWHVLYSAPITNPVSKGTRIFQPFASTFNNGIADETPDPHTTDYDVGKVIDGIHNGTVDCAVFEVNRSCSNCCGVDYTHIIEGLETISPLHFNGIRGSARAHTGDTVFFVGAVSGPSKGYVVNDNAPKKNTYRSLLVADRRKVPFPPMPQVSDLYIENFTGQIKIRTDGNHPVNGNITENSVNFSRFVAHGDSGSLLLNEQNMAVGLIFASDCYPGELDCTEPVIAMADPPGVPPLPAGSPAMTLYGYANHYEDVIAALANIGIQFEIKYTQPSTGGSRGETITGFAEPDSEVYESWKEKIENHPKTRAIFDAVLRHRDEVILLVNHCRPVMVAWHRGKGPAFAAISADNIREGKFEFPEVVNGASAGQLLLRMRDVLLVHGSNSLKDDLEKFGDEILAAVKGKNNFEDLLLALTGELSVENSLEFQQL
jgi:hypothetical protein